MNSAVLSPPGVEAPRLNNRHANIRTASRAVGVLAAMAGALSLFAKPDIVNVYTALAIFLGGVALSIPSAHSVRSDRLFRVFSALMLAVSILCVANVLTGWNPGIFRIPQVFSGMNTRPDTAISLPLLAFALLFSGREPGKEWRPSEWFALGAAMAVLPEMIGYFYGVRLFFGSFPSSSTSPPVEAFILFPMSIAVLGVHPDRGLMKIITGSGTGGMMARRLLPAAVVIPPLIGGLRLYGERQGYYDLTLGLALFATSNVLIFVGLILWNARSLDSIDKERRSAREALERSNMELDSLVRKRTIELLKANEDLESRVLDHRKSEKKFQDLIDAAPDAIVITDNEGGIVLVNRQAVETFGYSDQEILGRKIEVLMPERFREGHVEAREKYCRDPGYRLMDARWKFYGQRKNGSEFPAEISLNPSRIEKNLLVIAIVRDISDRVKVEVALQSYQANLEEKVSERTAELGEAIESLRISEERYRLLTESSLTGVYLIQDDLFRYVNPAFATIFGYTVEEIVDRKSPSDLNDPKDRERVNENIRRRLSGEVEKFHYELCGRKKNGEIIEIEAQGSYILYKGKPAITGSLLDVTESKRARELLAIQASELAKANRDLNRRVKELAGINRLSSIMEASLDPFQILESAAREILDVTGGRFIFIHHWDPDHRELRFETCQGPEPENAIPGTLEQVKILSEKVIQKGAPALFLSSDDSFVFLREGKMESLAIIPLTSSQTVIGALAIGSSSLDDFEGNRIEFLESLGRQLVLGLERAKLHAKTLDWTSELERKIAQRTSELEDANKELESFSYSVSHDLRAPLRAIDGFSQALLEDYSSLLDGEGKDYLNRVRAGAQRMGWLIDDILTLSKVTRNEVVKERVDLSDMVTDILHEITGKEARSIERSVMPDIFAQADSRLIRIALANLLDNAFKFTSQKEKTRIEFGRTMQDQLPVYFVRDNGVGFDMSHAGKLFGVFQRLHDVRDFPGTGIGLATVQRVVRKHGGKIWAESIPGEGSTFFFTLQDGDQ
jgi:PAS domain S-box-containing protein